MSDEAFDVADVPKNRLLIEASAGTGKTHALTGLAVHLLGRGEITVDRLLVVTYTRLATAELRSRIRSTLAATLAQLDRADPDPGVAEVAGALRAWDLEAARHNLGEALTRYDSVTVTTIHGFAQRALASLGSLAGVDPDFGVLADDTRLAAEAAADEYAIAAQCLAELTDAATAEAAEDEGSVDEAAQDFAGLLPSLKAVVDAAKMVDGAPDLRLLPEGTATGYDELREFLAGPDVTSSAVCAVLARRAADAAASRRQAAGVRSYNELLIDLRGALNSVSGEVLRQRLGEQFQAVLIDEFQDTDRIQWEIFDHCFGRDRSRLILVGDPKQAIYSFRGADVHTYARVAARDDMQRRVLATNWRSDAEVLAALEVLWHGVAFGEGIDFVSVDAAPGNDGTRLRRGDGATIAPVELAVADTDGLKASPKSKYLSNAIADRVISNYVVDHVVDLLENVCLADSSDASAPARPVRPDDIALLVRANAEGVALARALERANVPAVIHDNKDVRTASSAGWHNGDAPSEAAAQWRVLLDAVAAPSDTGRMRAAAVGLFGPLGDPTDLVDVDEQRIAEFGDRLVGWSHALTRFGPAEFIGRVWAESQVVPRVLARRGGDRLMTDLEHIGELFSVQVGSGPTSPDRLIATLDPESGGGAECPEKISNRRIPTGAPAVTIMTVHKSKGLQFPIVGCVGLQKLSAGQADRFYDDRDRCQVVDLAKSNSSKAAAEVEQRAENLRLLYVALTRARHHVFTCWTHEMNSPRGGLTRLLFARDANGAIDPEWLDAPKFMVPTQQAGFEVLDGLVGESGGTLGVRVLDKATFSAPPTVWNPPAAPNEDVEAEPLAVAELARQLDRRANRWSFTAITAREDVRHFDDEPLSAPGGDEGQQHQDDAEIELPTASGEIDPEAVSPLAWLPAGAAFGTLMHAVLEEVDFTDADLAESIRTELVTQLRRRPLDLTPTGPEMAGESGWKRCVDGLMAAIHTPLGRLWSQRGLCDLAPADRLSECNFELRLDATADYPVTAATIGSLALEHLASNDPYRDWAAGLAEGRFDVDLAGHLTGSIDLVARIDDDGSPRFVLADYKTNRLHAAGQMPGRDDYGPAPLVAAMVQHDYPLQALLYSVALHRYLRWRLPGYNPVQHLGGATYLFLRGMTPHAVVADGADPPGVATWEIPPTLVEALDVRFAGREVAE